MFGRKKVAMLLAEFLGTGVLALVVLAVQRSTIGIPYFVALAAGLAVAVLMYVFSAVSGGHFNPAITIGLWTARKVKTLPAVMYLIAQLLGGWAAYGVYTYFVNSSLQQLSSHFTARVLIAEAVGAFVFAFVWAAVAAQRLTVSMTGAAFALGIVIAAAASIGLINPALAISTRAWAVFGSNGWLTYALGPVIGGVVGVNLYHLLFAAPETVAVASTATVVTSSAPAATATSRTKSTRSTASRGRKTTTTRKRK